MKKTSAAISIKGEIYMAIFDTVDMHGRWWLVLRRGYTPQEAPECFRPDPRLMLPANRPGQGLDFVFDADPIPVDKYLDLPLGLRGFVITDF